MTNNNNVSNKSYSRVAGYVSAVTYIITASVILSMSYGYMEKNYSIVSGLLILSIIASYFNYSNMSRDYLQYVENNPYTWFLRDYPIIGPISIILTILLVLTLVTFNMFAWEAYLIAIIITIILGEFYKKRFNIEKRN